jgi:hypothetical protein
MSSPAGLSGWFWALLLAPAVVSLTGFLIGLSPNPAVSGLGAALGFFNCAVGLGCSIYCGLTLARRFCATPVQRVLATLGLAFAIGVVNLCIVAAGCVPTAMRNTSFH